MGRLTAVQCWWGLGGLPLPTEVSHEAANSHDAGRNLTLSNAKVSVMEACWPAASFPLNRPVRHLWSYPFCFPDRHGGITNPAW